MRRMFYDDDDGGDSQQTSVGTSTSTSATGPSTSGAGRGGSRGSTSVSANSNTRPGPYPKRSTTTTTMTARGASGSGSGSRQPTTRARAKAKGKESFIDRALNAPDFDSGFRDEGGDGMDVDVDSLDHTRGAGTNADADVDAMLSRETREARESDVTKLLRAWQDERHAPDILPSSDALLARVLDAIRRQVRSFVFLSFPPFLLSLPL